jgi:hypothetical protein
MASLRTTIAATAVEMLLVNLCHHPQEEVHCKRRRCTKLRRAAQRLKLMAIQLEKHQLRQQEAALKQQIAALKAELGLSKAAADHDELSNMEVEDAPSP